jgi:quinol monooxygenase YgiN
MAFVVAALWKAKEGEERRVEETIRTMTPLSRGEAGTLVYQAQVSATDPRTFLIYEQYVDESAFEEHKATPHFQEHVSGYILDYLEERQLTTYETIDV